MDDAADRTVVGPRHPGERSADELRRNAQRLADTRRLLPRGTGTVRLNRIADLAARLLGAPAGQVSLLTDVQIIAAGSGLPAGAVGSDGELEDSLCTVTAAGTGALVVPDADITTLRQLADSAVTELELSALVDQFEADRVRWGLAIGAAGIGIFDWDLVSGRLAWDDRLVTMFGCDDASFDQSIEAFKAPLHPDGLVRVTETLQRSIDTCGEYDCEYRVVRPDGETRWVHARGRTLAGPDGSPVRLLGAANDTTGQLLDEVLERLVEGRPEDDVALVAVRLHRQD